MAELVILNLGHAPYEPTLQLQQRLWGRVQASESELAYLVLVEHDPPVITLGRGADRRNVIATPEALAAAGVELHEASRGGDVTYHGPGQLVGYPILRVDRHGRDVHRYLRDVEEVLIGVLGRFEIDAGRSKGFTGVWVGAKKVAAIGIAIRRWVSYHGFALNVNPDLSHFNWIVPCGIRDKAVTSMAKLLGEPIDVSDVVDDVVQCTLDVFGFESARTGSVDEMDD